MAFSTLVFTVFLTGVVVFALILAYCSITDSRAPQIDNKA